MKPSKVNLKSPPRTPEIPRTRGPKQDSYQYKVPASAVYINKPENVFVLPPSPASDQIIQQARDEIDQQMLEFISQFSYEDFTREWKKRKKEDKNQ